jgi:hypothetical protein
MERARSEGGQGGRSQNKVARLCDEYGLEGAGEELEMLWTAPDEERRSLRSLADRFNQRLLAEAMSESGMQPVANEDERLYSVLAADEASSADQTRVRRRLERNGVDVDRLLEDFVSYQTIRRYLVDHRGAEYDPDGARSADSPIESVHRLRGRTAKVTESKLSQLKRAGALDLGETARVTVAIRALCEDCGSQFGLQELVDRGGCDCGARE